MTTYSSSAYVKVFFRKIFFEKDSLFVSFFSSSKTSTNREYRRNLTAFRSSSLGLILTDVTFGSLVTFLYVCVSSLIPVSYFFLVAIFLYPSPVPPLFFTRTNSSAAFNLNASFKIFPSLVCRFLNRYVLSLLSTPSHFFSRFCPLQDSFAVKPPLPEIIPCFFHLVYLQDFFFIILYQRKTRDLFGGIDITLKAQALNVTFWVASFA